MFSNGETTKWGLQGKAKAFLSTHELFRRIQRLSIKFRQGSIARILGEYLSPVHVRVDGMSVWLPSWFRMAIRFVRSTVSRENDPFFENSIAFDVYRLKVNLLFSTVIVKM